MQTLNGNLSRRAVGADRPRRVVAFPFGYNTGTGSTPITIPPLIESDDANAIGYAMPCAGSILAISAIVDVNLSLSGSISFNATLDAVDSFEFAGGSVSGGDGQVFYGTAVPGAYSFDAGAILGLERSTSGTCTTEAISASVFVELDL